MDAQQCEIRGAMEADVGDLFPIVVEFATSFVPERPAFQKAFQRLQGDDHARLLVADHDGVPVGYLLGFDHPTFFANGPVAWVEEVVVRSSWRRKGIGRALMARFEEWAASRGAKLVALATRRAPEFYRALGYADSATYFRKLL
jgi:GNAT superfamily N-acetyltransferase